MGEELLGEIVDIDRATAYNEWDKYIDLLLTLDRPDAQREKRLEQAVERFTKRGPDMASRIRNPTRWEQYKKTFSTYTHSANFVYFLRRETNRVDNLERVVRIGDALFTIDPSDPGARSLLLRACFAEEDLDRAWTEGFRAVRGKRTGAYYEASVLGSLSGQLDSGDVQVVMTHTAQDTDNQTPALMKLGEKASDVKVRTLLTPILRGAWRRSSGAGSHDRSATRELPFAEFVSVHVRLWLFEGFRLAMGSSPTSDSFLHLVLHLSKNEL